MLSCHGVILHTAAAAPVEGMRLLMFFEGFAQRDVTVGGVTFRLRQAGTGPMVMLLHGQPQTHAAWHAVAPVLARTHTVVCPDLMPARGADAMVQDLLALARSLGFENFCVAGQDLGGLIAARMALIAPERIVRLALLECVPPPEHSGRADMAFELSTYESCWFGQLHPKAEARSILPPSEWRTSDASDVFPTEAIEDYRTATLWRDGAGNALSFQPLLGAGDDRRVTCPTLVLWGREGRNGGWYDPASLWRPYLTEAATSRELDGGTFLAEEASVETSAALAAFFDVGTN